MFEKKVDILIELIIYLVLHFSLLFAPMSKIYLRQYVLLTKDNASNDRSRAIFQTMLAMLFINVHLNYNSDGTPNC